MFPPPTDREMASSHRKLVLSNLELAFKQDENHRKSLKEMREMWAKQTWLVLQLRKHVPEEIFRNIWIESEVSEMDPDFCFYKAVFGEEPPLIKPLNLSGCR